MERRLFLRALGLTAASTALAVEAAADALGLPVPTGLFDTLARPLVIPATPRATLNDINEIMRKYIIPGLEEYMFRNDPLLKLLKERTFHPRINSTYQWPEP